MTKVDCVLVQEGKLLSFGRPTYGRLGQQGVDPASDEGCPGPAPVEGLEGQAVHQVSAGGSMRESCTSE